jgi:hypothetical protein
VLRVGMEKLARPVVGRSPASRPRLWYSWMMSVSISLLRSIEHASQYWRSQQPLICGTKRVMYSGCRSNTSGGMNEPESVGRCA